MIKVHGRRGSYYPGGGAFDLGRQLRGEETSLVYFLPRREFPGELRSCDIGLGSTTDSVIACVFIVESSYAISKIKGQLCECDIRHSRLGQCCIRAGSHAQKMRCSAIQHAPAQRADLQTNLQCRSVIGRRPLSDVGQCCQCQQLYNISDVVRNVLRILR